MADIRGSMIFLYKEKQYAGATAVEIVRQMAGDVQACPTNGGTIRDYLSRSLSALSDRIHIRELGTSPHLSEETLAFNYLCLLDEYELGCLDLSPNDLEARTPSKD